MTAECPITLTNPDCSHRHVLSGQVRARQSAMEHAQALLLEAQRAGKMVAESEDEELEVADRLGASPRHLPAISPPSPRHLPATTPPISRLGMPSLLF